MNTTTHVKLSLTLTFQYLYIPFVLLYIIEQGTIHQHDFENNNHFCTQPKHVSFILQSATLVMFILILYVCIKTMGEIGTNIKSF